MHSNWLRTWWLAGIVVPVLLAGCQRATSSDLGSLEAIASRGELRAVVVGDDLPYAQKIGSGYEGLSIFVLDSILSELNEILEPVKPIRLSIEAASSVADGLQRITGGQADMACGVTFTRARQQDLDYTLPFATGGVRVLVPAVASGTPDGLVGKNVAIVQGSSSTTILKGQAPKAELRPADPYARSGVSCVVAANNHELRVLGSIAIGQLMRAYLDDNAEFSPPLLNSPTPKPD